MAAVTPGRRTYLWLDIAEKTLGRPPEVVSRTAAQMGQPRPRMPIRSQNVTFLGDAWILRPREAELAQTVMPAPSGLGGGITGGPVKGTEVDKAPGVTAVPMFRKEVMTWATPGANVITSGLPAFQRNIPAGTTTTPKLPDLPPPFHIAAEDPPQMYPLSRIIGGNLIYPENTPWLLRLEMPQTWEGGDIFYRFYFGGMSDTSPHSEGGSFMAEFRGGGECQLYEADGTPGPTFGMQFRKKFDYADGSAGVSQLANVIIIPHATNRIAFFSMANEFYLGGYTLLGLAATVAQMMFEQMRRNMYYCAQSETGHQHLRAATGPGTIHMFQRDDLRTKFSVIRMRYPSLQDNQFGLLVDAPFATPFDLPFPTTLQLHIDAHLMPGTAVTGAIYNAATNLPLATDTFGHFVTVPNQRVYYVVLTLTSADGLQTPVLWSYQVLIPGAYKTNLPDPIRLDIEEVHIEGPDTDASHEQATVVLRDIKGEADILRRRDRIRGTISVHSHEPSDPTDGLITHLFEGETLAPEGEWRGKPGVVHPDPQWRDYRTLRLVGMWARCADQLSLSPPNFFSDPAVAPGPGGLHTPWKVTTIIRYMLNAIGFDDDEIDVPNLEIRLWSAPTWPVDPAVYQMAAGTDPAQFIRTLAWDYLQMVLVRDANAGPRGMWRLHLNPWEPYINTVLDIYCEPPEEWTAGPRLQHVLGAYGDGKTYAISWRRWMRAPEVNVVTIQGWGATPGQKLAGLIQFTYVNDDSINDHTSPDYLGRAVRVVFPVDTSLTSYPACQWMAERVMFEAGHAKVYFECQAPLTLISDPLDQPPSGYQQRPRLPRINDLIRVKMPGHDWIPCMVRTVKVDYSSDQAQMMVIQGVLLLQSDFAIP